jgi:hypothetical protein
VIGMSRSFHEEKNIDFMFNLLKKRTNHNNYEDMTKTTAQWWIDNIQFVALQIYDTPGNGVIFCKHGRTRSPMYLVAYLVIIYGLSPELAVREVRRILREQRGELLDRFESLIPIIIHIYQTL